MNNKGIQKEIRRYTKIKKHLRKGDEKYNEVRDKIKDLREKHKEIERSNPEKDIIIAEIIKLTESFFVEIMDYKNFTIEQLKFHLGKLKEKRGKK